MSVARQAVFLSYAREDAAAARRIAEALRASGVEVWFDETELRGGDAWDAKIRRQIRECALFLAVVSANTQTRLEGYFRLEWKLAAQRTHTMAEAKPFLLPMVIDGTDDVEAHVPSEFCAVQWTYLPDGEVPPGFCERVQGLLAELGSGGTRARFPGHGRAPPLALEGGRRGTSFGGRSAPPFPPPPAMRWRLAAVGLAAAAAAVLAVWQPWRGAGPAAMAPAAVTLTPQRSESTQLVAKARALFEESDDLNRENYHLAEEILKRAVAMDVTDAEAWAAYAQLSVEFYRYGFDRTGARIEAMRTQAERALRLAPESVNAQIAIAEASDYLGLDQTATGVKLRALSERAPDNWRVLHALGRKLGRAGKIDEAQTALARADELARDNPALWADAAAYFLAAGRYAEAEIATAKSLARRSNLRALVYNAILTLCWRGDKAAAVAGVEAWPSWALIEDRGCALAGLVYSWARQPEKALAIYQRMPRDYLTDQFFTGPRAALSALAHAQAGHVEAARADWQRALQRAERAMVESPGDSVALYWKGWALAQLGDASGALNILQQLEQRNWMPPSYFAPEAKAAGLTVAIGRPEQALRFLERDVTGPGAEQPAVFRNAFVNFRLTRAVLELNPIFDPLRKDPRFQRLIERAAAPFGMAASATAPDRSSVAVLAFKNLAPDRENEYFSDGISDELINVLGRISGLRVIGRTSAFAFKNKEVTAAEIGEKLNVAHLVEGSVQRAGSRARINASLIRAQTGEQMWADGFEFDLKDVFTAQEAIAARIAKSLSLTLGNNPRIVRSVNPDAHVLVLEARHHFTARTYEGFARAEKALLAALQIDPQFAEARACLGLVWITRARYSETDGMRQAPQEAEKGEAEARRAIALDPSVPDGYLALGYAALWDGEFFEAEQQLRKALALNQNSADVRHFLGLVYACRGKLDLAIAEHQLAATLEPLGWMNLQNFARALYWAQRFGEALTINERAAATRLGSEMFIPNRGEQARLSWQLGRRDDAVAAALSLRQNPNLYPRWQLDSAAVRVLWRAGRKREAQAYADELFEKWPADHYQRGFVLTALERFDEALPYLERTPAQPVRYLYWDEMWDPWRDDPRFKQVIAKLGRTEEYQTARESLARLQAQAGSQAERAAGGRK